MRGRELLFSLVNSEKAADSRQPEDGDRDGSVCVTALYVGMGEWIIANKLITNAFSSITTSDSSCCFKVKICKELLHRI